MTTRPRRCVALSFACPACDASASPRGAVVAAKHPTSLPGTRCVSPCRDGIKWRRNAAAGASLVHPLPARGFLKPIMPMVLDSLHDCTTAGKQLSDAADQLQTRRTATEVTRIRIPSWEKYPIYRGKNSPSYSVYLAICKFPVRAAYLGAAVL